MGVAAVVLARATRERRAQPLGDGDRKLGLKQDETLACGLRRMALGQVDLALDELASANAGGERGERAVHETRKALKRLRALLRLLRHELGEGAFAREDAAVRDIARRLSGARDAEVMLATLDALIERHPRKLARLGGVRRLRRALLAEHERVERQTLGDSAALEQVLSQLRALRVRAAAWPLRDRDGTKLVDEGLRDLYAQGRRRFGRAARKQGKDVRAMHLWRKRVKELRYAAEMLERRPRSHKQRRGRSARLRRLAARADTLAEVLGEDHDLAVLAERVRAESGAGKRPRKKSRPIGRATRKTLLKLIARRRRKLRRLALRDGERLYRRRPKKFLRELS
jgi:CHAD domain-containing protein